MTDEQAPRKVFGEGLAKLSGSVSVSDELAAKLAELHKWLKNSRARVTFLKKQVMCADTEKLELERVVADVCEKSEQRMVRLNVALAGWSRPEKLTRSVVTESVNAVNAVVQQLRRDAVNSLRQGLQRAG